MKTALITGASSGLGKEFVRQLADDPAIAQFWVIARRKERLLELQKFTSKPVIAIPLDLCDPHSFDILTEKLQAEKPDITVLVAAAGLGSIGKTEELSVAETNRMIDLNCRAAAAVTRLCLPYMHKGARILEIASIAAFQPMPGFNVYAASKAFLMSYTKALHHELLPRHIKVTCVCPYWVKDTEFIPKARITGNSFRHTPLASVSKSVVRLSLAASKANLWVCTPGIVTTAQRIVAKVIPHCIVVPFMDLIRHF